MQLSPPRLLRNASRRAAVAGVSLVAAAATLTTAGAPASAATPETAPGPAHSDAAAALHLLNGPTAKPRTVITTDMEQDDYASLIRYLLYTDELDTEGLIYTSSRFHWAGDGKGTLFFLPGREYKTPQTSWRWTGTRTIQDLALKAYAEVYPNLKVQDPDYPTPADLLSKVKVGNIDFEGEMSHDTDGSNLIKKLLLDNDPRQVYLQTWGGTSTIARALKSIQDQYAATPQWANVYAKVSKKAVILASGFQDTTYADYIAPNWPNLRTEQLSAGYAVWGYNCNFTGAGNTRGLPNDNMYFQGSWIKQNIQVGPLGSLYRSWLDGQSMPGDPLDIFGDPVLAKTGWCPPQQPYDFLSEGDDVAYFPLLPTGIEAPDNPNLGSWGGRAAQTSTSPDLWTSVASETDPSGARVRNYTWSRWEAAVQNDFAARMQWTLTPSYPQANHPPQVGVLSGRTMTVAPGQTVNLRGLSADPDGNRVAMRWWQYAEEGTYPGKVTFGNADSAWTTVTVPADAAPGQTVSLILQGTDNGDFPLTRYARVTLRVVPKATPGEISAKARDLAASGAVARSTARDVTKAVSAAAAGSPAQLGAGMLGVQRILETASPAKLRASAYDEISALVATLLPPVPDFGLFERWTGQLTREGLARASLMRRLDAGIEAAWSKQQAGDASGASAELAAVHARLVSARTSKVSGPAAAVLLTVLDGLAG